MERMLETSSNKPEICVRQIKTQTIIKCAIQNCMDKYGICHFFKGGPALQSW